ncbi:MAG: MoxR family ATPase [Chloroflexi bacterium]|nr:MoxR family ATPase [Chloroflexota bacterium]
MQDTASPTAIARRIIENINKVIVGKTSVVEQAVATLIADGHLLVEDVPGVGKTMLAKSLSISIGCSFKRIQFTPDLLPSDVTGISVYNQQRGEFEFREGPIMAQVVLADEINRATPKTQSALLEAMEEHQVTVDGITHHLETPFLVMATQNPIEYEGTFPLPEAQLDRFLMRISLGYPEFMEELSIIERQEQTHPIDSLGAVATPDDIRLLQQGAKAIYVDQLVRQYIVSLTEATRRHSEVSLGASPRASLGLFRAIRAMALVQDRDYVIPDDVKMLAPAIIAHRLVLSPSARMRGVQNTDVVNELLRTVPVPGAARQPTA